MSSQSQSVEHATECIHDFGFDCTKTGAGHSIHPMQYRLVAATPSKWVDYVVTARPQDGWVGLRPLDSDIELRIWHHDDLIGVVTEGEPVALHGSYNLFAVGNRWFNVLIA